MKDKKACFSHKSDDWATPKKLYNYFMEKGYIDPCPIFSKEDNLNKIYVNQKIFINPPYSQIDKWVEFAKNNRNNEIIFLIPARTDTKYFHELMLMSPYIYFIKGRLHFNESKSAPFPSILVKIWSKKTIFNINLYGSGTIEEYIELGK